MRVVCLFKNLLVLPGERVYRVLAALKELLNKRPKVLHPCFQWPGGFEVPALALAPSLEGCGKCLRKT